MRHRTSCGRLFPAFVAAVTTITTTVAAAFVLGVSLPAYGSAADAERMRTAGAERFAPEIDAFEESDRTKPPAPGAVLFVGSSSIRMWKTLARDMAPLRTINRGFGGSHLAHVDHYADRIVAPYLPRAVVLYAGDNDLSGASPKTPERVLEDLELFVAHVHRAVPKAPVYFLAIKPSLARFAKWPSMQRANALVRSFAERTPLVEYVDVATPMLGDDGAPDETLFIADGLHMNERGYALWTSIVKPVLEVGTPEPPAASAH